MNLTYLEFDHTRTPYDALTGKHREEFQDRLTLSWLYHDHALEGVALSREEIERALDCKPSRNYCDGEKQKSIRRLKREIERIHREAREGRTLTREWIRDLHIRMCGSEDEAAGRYRQRDTSPGVYNLDIVQSNSISYHFHKLLDDYREEYCNFHPVRRAAITHWEFMRVFPFDDRTGVVGRLMLNFLLLKSDYPPATIHATDRHHYFQALRGHREDLVPVVVEGIQATIAAAETFTDEAVERGIEEGSYRSVESVDNEPEPRRRAL